MPECGNMGLPPELLRQAVTDMVRISDARMGGTVVLDVAPESAVGGLPRPDSRRRRPRSTSGPLTLAPCRIVRQADRSRNARGERISIGP